ncbi:hypothetical protein VE25_03755 [Devosia geojensis]|uniref:Uncharacterized protein n=1 Tax=Devosia geojensis TaxID=443610 RepID=A0A0F5FY44_9HYPH|nr:efflux RND transporter periplasmic adaptor subunit [Devosia geojensis]KKB13077.1 hypothetical protein VE25_03755 [Devosia geojensis]
MTTDKQAGSPKPEWAQSKHDKENVARVAAGLPPRRRRWPFVLLALVVLGVIAAVVVMSRQQPAETVAEAVADPVRQLNSVEIATVEPSTLAEIVRVTGSLAPQRQTELSSQVSARVIAVLARPGDAVESGDVLVQLDTESLRVQLDQATSTAEATRAQLVLADSQLARTRDLIERGVTASSGLEQAQSSADALRANLAALEAQVAAAQIAMQNATVRAPMDGIVSSRTVEPGQTVQQGASLLTLVDLTSLEMQAASPIGPSAQIEPGQTVEVTVEGLPGRTFEGTVSRVNPVAASGTRTIPVYISLDNEEGLLRGGMFATGLISVVEKPDALSVPATALREDAEGVYVLKVEDGAVVRQAIEQAGQWSRGRVIEVASGLEAGDIVVTAPLTQLQPGDKVEMVED